MTTRKPRATRRTRSLGDSSITSKVTAKQFKDAAAAALRRRGEINPYPHRSWGYGLSKQT